SEVSAPEEVQTFETEPEPAKPEPVDDTLATPIVLRKTGDKQPEVFTQHVLRGVILRKFLNVSTIAKKLRETEQHALGATALKPSGGGSLGRLRRQQHLLYLDNPRWNASLIV
ncbi:hypothetical protein PI124_g22213, partial [Phytophthora idaei]